VIVASPEHANGVARINLFHLLISFMEATCFIMICTGLEEPWRFDCGSDSVTHIYDGHPYSRALKLHTHSV